MRDEHFSRDHATHAHEELCYSALAARLRRFL